VRVEFRPHRLGLFDGQVKEQHAIDADIGCPRHKPIDTQSKHRVDVREQHQGRLDARTHARNEVERRLEMGARR
jgi:hypothetical protein